MMGLDWIEDWTFTIFTKGKSVVWRTVKQFALTGRKINRI
jgi:hypothetical protein